MFRSISIEDWILPAVFAEHFNHIIWVKPTWSNQMELGKTNFFIGLDNSTGKLRLVTILYY